MRSILRIPQIKATKKSGTRKLITFYDLESFQKLSYNLPESW